MIKIFLQNLIDFRSPKKGGQKGGGQKGVKKGVQNLESGDFLAFF